MFREIIPFILLVIGLFYLGSGISGMVISQSCCFMPNCDSENACSQISQPENTTFLGLTVVIAGAGLYVFLRKY